MNLYEDTLDLTKVPREWRGPMQHHASKLCEALGGNVEAWAGHDLNKLVKVREANPGNSFIAECVDPNLHPGHGPHDTLVIVLTRGEDEQPVACTAIRWLWSEGPLGRSIEQGILGTRGQRLICSGDLLTRDIEAQHVAWSGGTFVRKGEDPNMFPAMMRLAFMHALATRPWAWLSGMCRDELGDGPWSLKRLGMQRVENGIVRIEPHQRTPYVVVGTHRRQLVEYVCQPRFADLSWNLGEPGGE